MNYENLNQYTEEPTTLEQTEIINFQKMPGGAIRDIAMGLILLTREMRQTEFLRNISSDIQIHVIVLDTNIILNELSHIYKTNKETKLLGEAETGFVRLLVTPAVIEEVKNEIPQYSSEIKVDPNYMYSLWNIYKTKLNIIQPEEKISPRLQELAARDADDLPTAQLIETVGPTLALSQDKDLKDYKYAQPDKNWLQYVFYTNNSINKDVSLIVIKAGGTLIFAGANEGLLLVAKTFNKVIKNIPSHLIGSLGISLAGLFCHSRSRKWFLNKIRPIITANVQDFSKIKESINKYLSHFMEKNLEWEKSKEHLKKGSPDYMLPANLKGYIIRVLIRSPYSLSSKEIMEGVKELGYQPRGVYSEQYLRRILRNDSYFCQDKNGCWQLNTYKIQFNINIS